MSRYSFAIAVLALAVAAFLPTDAAALDSVQEALCVCADDVLNMGDYVSCVSHMTRRLEAKGLIDRFERSDLVSGASHTDLEALQDECSALGAGGELDGWGVSLHIDRPFQPAWSISGPTGGLTAILRLWNMTDDDIFQTTDVTPTPANPSGEGCWFIVRLLDSQGRVVRRSLVACFDMIGPLNVLSGEILEKEIIVPMVAENADPSTGLANGDKLFDGIYRLEVVWEVHGPQETLGVAMEGGRPMAVITLRVGG